MTDETKNKIRAAHKNRAKDPAVLERLKALANDPAMKAARSAKMKAKWADPVWRTKQLTKMGSKVAISTPAPVEAPDEPMGRTEAPKRVISAEKKAQYAAARKAKRAAAKATA